MRSGKTKKRFNLLKVTALALTGTLLMGMLFLPSSGESNLLLPHTPEEFSKTAVEITTMAENSGGTGVILSSHNGESDILTNNHICEAIKEGGLVQYQGKKLLINGYKKSKEHDLCLIRVRENLGISTRVANKAPERMSNAIVVGHPGLLPDLITKGHFSDKLNIKLIVGMKKCENKENASLEETLLCLLMGGMPILKSFESQVISAMIAPGNSGSPVYNDQGEIAGLVFAGNGQGISYGFIVPQEYVFNFVTNESIKMEWTSVSDEAVYGSSKKSDLFNSDNQ